MRKLLGKLGKVLFHRLGIVGVLIVLQIGLYTAGLVWLRGSRYYNMVAWAFLLLAVLVVIWIVAGKSNPGYKIGWIVIVLGLMPFGSLAYLMLGGNRLSRFNQKRLRSMERKLSRGLDGECHRSDVLAEVAGEDAGRMARYLERMAHCPVYGNTGTTYYPLGDDCYNDLLAALRGAQSYIFIEYFIIEEGKLWNSVLDILKEKAARGVEVRVIYDDIGSISTLPADYPNRLEAVGVHCQVFNRFVPVVSLRQNNRDHRKYMIVDGRVAFTGGINMADEYINVKPRFGHWKDSAIRLEGDAVWSMTVSFLAMWGFTCSQEEDLERFRPAPSPHRGTGYVQPYQDCPWDDEAVGLSVYLNLINRAHRYVYITTPYLVIDYSVTVALTTAAKSGVDVRIITPHIPDKRTVFAVTRSYYRELLEAGVRIFEYEPGFIHSKNFVVDDRYATVGTVNLDYRSMFLHFENGVLLYDTPSVADIRGDFLDTQGKSREIVLEDGRSVSPLRRLIWDLLRLFAPLL
jgi:cardiolipin synthase